MRLASTIATLTAVLTCVNAQSGAWGQCAGIGWTGATTCIAGYTCTYSNPYYSQCLPGSSTPTTTVPPTTTTTTTTTKGTTTTTKSTTTTTKSTTTTVQPTTSTTTTTGPAPTGSQIRTDQDPVYHLYLQNIGGVPELGAVATSGYFTIGSTIALNGGSSKLYLNVLNATTSYKPLSFNTTSTASTWGLSGDTITYSGQQNFLVCPITGSTNWNLYLQTGNDVPAGVACANYITIHLPCLC